jgi:uncharacterized damage-inducible protein DinB
MNGDANDSSPASVDTAAYMQDPERRQRRLATHDEKALLVAFLDFQRDTVLWKISGLTTAQAREPRTPSGMSLLGLVKHLAYVERNWFQARFLARTVLIPWRSGDPDGDFRVEADDTLEAVIAFYRAEVAESRRIVAAAESLETVARNADRPVSLRWILIHMIEETARHVGHADLMREATDGATGE